MFSCSCRLLDEAVRRGRASARACPRFTLSEGKREGLIEGVDNVEKEGARQKREAEHEQVLRIHVRVSRVR